MAGKGGLAEKIRVGLEDEEKIAVLNTQKTLSTDPLDELYFRKPIRKHVAQFGQLCGAIGIVVATMAAWKGNYASTFGFAFVGIILAVLGAKAPRLLKPVWEAWMLFAHYLGIVSTFIIVLVGWIVLIVPVALGLKVVGKRSMDTEFRKAVSTYWETRDSKYDDFQRMKREF